MSGDQDWVNYESGPFCRHWGDPSDCQEVCANCPHRCTRHGAEDGDSKCYDCDCLAWQETEEAA